jgi:hypothetical protein
MAKRRRTRDIDLTPPKAVQDQARRGLELREQHGRGGTQVGVRRARQLAEGKALSPRDIKSMYSYFARHEVDRQGRNWDDPDKLSAGRIAWELWGGNPGRAWVEDVRARLDKAEQDG